MDDAGDDAVIGLALMLGVDHRRCGSIAAHCSSLSQKLPATNHALLTDLNHDDFQLYWCSP